MLVFCTVALGNVFWRRGWYIDQGVLEFKTVIYVETTIFPFELFYLAMQVVCVPTLSASKDLLLSFTHHICLGPKTRKNGSQTHN